MKRLLVTTVLAESHIEGRESLLLGEWCKLPSEPARWSTTPHEVLPFHWDTVGKRAADYRYLESIVREVMTGLADDLNACHSVDLPLRYWQIVLGSWLSMHVATLFDRWETIRLAFKTDERFESVVVRSARFDNPPSGSLDHVLRAVDDRYNHELFADIIEQHYGAQCDLTAVHPQSTSAELASGEENPLSIAPRSVVRRLFKNVVRRFAEHQRNNDVVFANCYFSWSALIRLNLLLGQLPRQYPELAWVPPKTDATADVRAVRESLRAATNRRETSDVFLAYLWGRIAGDLPSSCVESLADLRSRAGSLGLKCNVIVTANSHWHNELFKVWAAERVLDGAKLVICEHGGSFPAAQYVLDFEENMADVYVPTYLAHHPKHFQLPPTKYLDIKAAPLRDRRFISIIAFDNVRFSIRASAQPHSRQALDIFDDTIRFFEALPGELRSLVRIKMPEPSDIYWRLDEAYASRLGADFLLSQMPLSKAFELSRVIVCTYPQSTFAEALLSGIPTVMMFDPRIHGLHPVSGDVVDQMLLAKILFHNPLEAAAHVAAIWNREDEWWSSQAVAEARESYHRATMTRQSRPLLKWRSFLRSLSRSAQLARGTAP